MRMGVVLLAAIMLVSPGEAAIVASGFDVWRSEIVKDRIYSEPDIDASIDVQSGIDSDGWLFTNENAFAIFNSSRSVDVERGGGTATRYFEHSFQSDIREFQSFGPDRFTHQSSVLFSTTLYGSIRHSSYGNFFFVSQGDSESKGFLHRVGRFVVDQPVRLSLRLDTPDASSRGASEMLSFFGLQAGDFTFADHLFYFSRSQLQAGGQTSYELTMSHLGVDYSARVLADAGWMDLEIDLAPTTPGVPVELRYQWLMDPSHKVSISTAVSTTRTVSETSGFFEDFSIVVVPEPSTAAVLAVAMEIGLCRRIR
jgi:hypothetical protein